MAIRPMAQRPTGDAVCRMEAEVLATAVAPPIVVECSMSDRWEVDCSVIARIGPDLWFGLSGTDKPETEGVVSC